MTINKYKIKVRQFTAELPQLLDRELRTYLTIETDIYDVSTPSNENGEYDQVYIARLVGSCIVKQQGSKEKIITKSKRSPSQRLRYALYYINESEDFYILMIEKIINNAEAVCEWLRDK